MKNIFTAHPHAIGETYMEHLKFALVTGCKMIMGGMVLIIHAFFPFLFLKLGGKMLFKTTHCFITRMSEVDQEVLAISQLIEKKVAG